ncbi:hypothetical protein LguiB_021700 [Lonicera macranthoides]
MTLDDQQHAVLMDSMLSLGNFRTVFITLSRHLQQRAVLENNMLLTSTAALTLQMREFGLEPNTKAVDNRITFPKVQTRVHLDVGRRIYDPKITAVLKLYSCGERSIREEEQCNISDWRWNYDYWTSDTIPDRTPEQVTRRYGCGERSIREEEQCNISDWRWNYDYWTSDTIPDRTPEQVTCRFLLHQVFTV